MAIPSFQWHPKNMFLLCRLDILDGLIVYLTNCLLRPPHDTFLSGISLQKAMKKQYIYRRTLTIKNPSLIPNSPIYHLILGPSQSSQMTYLPLRHPPR